jgi:hypothetical protein
MQLPSPLQERVASLASNPILCRGRVGAGQSRERPFFSQASTLERFSVNPIDHGQLPPLPVFVADALSFVNRDREIHLGPWTIWSVDDVRERYATLGFSAFAHRYAGMGHVMCLGYCAEHDVVFQFLDGGANGFDRIANEKRACALSAQDMYNKRIDFDQILQESNFDC